MLDEQMYISELYDYYQSLLTDKQKEYFEDYYFENLTIQEIADENLNELRKKKELRDLDKDLLSVNGKEK